MYVNLLMVFLSYMKFMITLPIHYKKNIRQEPLSEFKEIQTAQDVIDLGYQAALVTIVATQKFPEYPLNNPFVNGTGFFVRCFDGIILANKNLASKFTDIKIILNDGSTYNGGVIYEDPFLSFSLIQIKSNSTQNCKQLHLEHSAEEKVGDKVALLGMDESKNLLIQFGRVEKINSNISKRFGSLLKVKYMTSKFNYTNGLQMSLLINIYGKTIGLHILSDLNKGESFSLKIGYIIRVLRKKTTESPVGEIGVMLQPINEYDATTSFYFNPIACKSTSKNFLVVSGVIQDFPSDKKLSSGDIILSINNMTIYDNMLKVDSILNDHVGKEISVQVCRNGVLKDFSITVDDGNLRSISKFFYFNNKLFLADIDSNTRFKNPMLNMKGFLANYQYANDKENCNKTLPLKRIRKSWIFKVNAENVVNLESFFSILQRECQNGTKVLMEGYDLETRDIFTYSTQIDITRIDAYQYNCVDSAWVKTNFDISSTCNNKETGALVNNTDSSGITKPIITTTTDDTA